MVLKVFWSFLVFFGRKTLPSIIKSITPELRERFRDWLELERLNAHETDNPWDDALFDGLWAMFGFGNDLD